MTDGTGKLPLRDDPRAQILLAHQVVLQRLAAVSALFLAKDVLIGLRAPEPMTADERAQIEAWVREAIAADVLVRRRLAELEAERPWVM